LLLGLDNAGKTTILKTISGENLKNLPPTKGFNVKVFEKDNIKFTFWDLGGQKSIRHVWENYFEDNDAIVI
jgi:small GTP-binding protein